MKNFLSIATCYLIVSVIISFTSCTAQTTPKGNLKTEVDSLSYTTGVASTQGLDQYLMQMGLNLTDEYKADFVKGVLEGAKINKDDMKTLAYMKGKDIGLQIGTQMLPGMNANIFGSDSTKSLDKNLFLAGFVASYTKKNLLIDELSAQTISTALSEKIANEANQKYLVENTAFLDKNKEDPTVVVLPSGLQYKVVTEGTGEKPIATDKVKVNYVGKTIQGKEFDSTITRGEPAEFALNQVIPGWTEGIQLMPVGSKYTFYIPYNLAYGEKGRPGSIDPYATLIFEVELLDIVK